ncbi:MAG: hypothetical protein CL930_11120 [Deltaproteobacteria bacterium]|nr:hypothetical protein [Deltaproteobacteria bacterium]
MENDPRCKGIKFVTFFNQGDLIQGSIDNLLDTALWGGLFAIVVLFAFLRQWKMTLLIAACIPFTLLLTVTTTYFAGRSLNLLSLMGLMLAVGMVVDNAIVVVESIDARRQQGDGVQTAAVKGTTDIGLAITLSTLTTMVVFLPIILMSGDADFSFFMSELGMPVVWALGISLLVALFFTPLTTTVIQNTKASVEPPWVTWLSNRYRNSLQWFLSNRTDALMLLISLVFVTMVVPVQAVGCNQASEGNLDDFGIRYKVSADASYYDRLNVIETIDAYVEENKERWGVRTWRARMRDTSQRGSTTVYLAEREDGMLQRDDVIDDAKENLPQIAGVELGIGWGGSGGPPINQIEIFLHGEDTLTLERLGNSVQRVINAIPGVVGAIPEMEAEGGREIRLSVDRDSASRHGISPQQIGRTVGFALRASALPEFHEGNKDIDVVARFRLDDRKDLSRLLDFPMFSPTTMKVVPLRTVTNTDYAQGISSIHRENRITSYPITVDLEDGLSKEQAWSTMERALREMQFPEGYTWSKSWSQEQDREEDDARNMALLLSVIFVFLIMGVLFESFLLPMSIITTVPMAFLGVYWMLFLTDTSFDTMSGVGLVILVGVVVNNGIVYIDLVTRLRESGTDRLTALIEGGTRRLRPILMTALTTIFGLVPMTIGDASFVGMPYAPLGRVVVGGLATGTLLTLFLLPFLYTILDDMRGTSRRWLAHLIGQNTTSEVAK